MILTQQAVLVILAHGTPPLPCTRIGKDQIVVYDTCHVQRRAHREVISSATADLLVVAHDAILRLPEVDPARAERIAQRHPHVAQHLKRRSGPIGVTGYEARHVGHVADICINAVAREE